jgi:hypothetical protein
MCYSARIQHDYRRYVREFGAGISIEEFYDLFWRRVVDPRIKIAKAMEAPFETPASEPEVAVKAAIDAYKAAQIPKVQQELFAQRKRLADAERILAKKPTKAAAESQRIATDKIEAARAKLIDFGRAELEERDSRIFPGYFAPVMVMENGRRRVKPMRYQCRPAGKPASTDFKFPGTYNARKATPTAWYCSMPSMRT